MKKKLYVSRFQASLKEIMKYNTDGDLLNAFTKHIEVITAALGVTFVEMTNLKKLYYRKNRILEDRRRRAKQGSSSQTRSLTGGDAYGGGDQSFDGGREVVSGMRSLGIAASVRTFTSSSTAAMSARDGSQATVVASANHHASSSQLLKSRCNSFHSNQWQTDMMRKCDETLALLQKIQTTAQTIR